MSGEKPVVPCGKPDSFGGRPLLHSLSCAARESGVLVAAHFFDRRRIPYRKDPMLLSTLVVFDSIGAVIAKYHKTHLYSGEPRVFDSAPPFAVSVSPEELGGVTLGLLLSFDVYFAEPQRSLLRQEAGVSAVIVPLAGASKPGSQLLTPTANIQSWSATHRVNVMAPNLGSSQRFSAGSGIFSGGRAIAHSSNPMGQTRLLSGVLPGTRPPPPPESPAAVKLISPPAGTPHFVPFHAVPGESRSITVSFAGQVVCRFNISVAGDSAVSDKLYGVRAFADAPGRGRREFGYWNTTMCTLNSCAGNNNPYDPYECLTYAPTTTSDLRLDRLTIEMYLPRSSRAVWRFDTGDSVPEVRYLRVANNTHLLPLSTGASSSGRRDFGFAARLDYVRQTSHRDLRAITVDPLSSACTPPNCFDPDSQNQWLEEAHGMGMLSTSIFMMEFAPTA